jgi:hypothetical protein
LRRRAPLGLLVALVARAAAGAGPGAGADVVSVSVAGEPGAYRFAVGVRSPDQDCARYASWWEVLRTDGSLAYRRILTHSHVGEQPFVRDGGPVAVGADEEVVVRAYFHPDGYGGAVLRGTPRGGLRPWQPPDGFAAALAAAPPQPDGCRF